MGSSVLSAKHRRGIGALAVLSACGCTLLAHNSSEAPHCERSEQCEVLNENAGIGSSECMRYRCDVAHLVCGMGPRDDDTDGDAPLACGGSDCDDADARRSGGVLETCNAIDDDCDLVIDEGALFAGNPIELAPERTGVSSLLGTETDEGLAIALGIGERSEAVTELHFVGTGSSTLRYRTQEETAGGVPSPFTRFTPTDSCYPFGSSCNATDVAIAALDGGRFAIAAISDVSGCGAGQLRAGFADASGELWTIGPPARGAPAFGVDVATAAECTGTLSGITLGAARPALAALGDDSLLVYLARPTGTIACGPEAYDVRAIGLWLTGAPVGGETVSWIDATGANLPSTLGRALGDGRPAIAAIDEPPGYVVAFPDESAGIALHFIPRFEIVSPVSSDECERSGDPTACDVPHDTPPLPESIVLGMVSTDGADELAIAAGDRIGEIREIGLAWQSGCGDASSGVYFARVRVVPDRAGSLGAGTIHAMGSDGARSPALTYASSGLVMPGYSRDGESAEQTGGWTLGWIEDGRALVRRILAFDGAHEEAPASTLPNEGARAIVLGNERIVVLEECGAVTSSAQCRRDD